MSSLTTFSIEFQEVFPPFSRAPLVPNIPSYLTNDTRTIAIIGLGKRTEYLVKKAKGKGLDGEPVNFDIKNVSNGRFFKTTSFPVSNNSYTLYRGFQGIEVVPPTDYYLDRTLGYIILYTPLTSGETLKFVYISEADINYPRVFDNGDLSLLINIYGTPSQENTLSAAASLAFTNNAPRVLVVQGDHTGFDPYWYKAYQALENQQVYGVVPCPNGYYNGVIAAGIDHVQRMSDTPNRRERFLIIGENISTTVTDNITRDLVSSYNSEDRVIFIAADNPSTVFQGESIYAGGGFLATALAGAWFSSEYIPTTLTSQFLQGISILVKSHYSQTELNQFVKDGITMVLSSQTKGQVYQFVTTLNNGNPLDEEPPVWKIKDYVAITIRTQTENNFTGTALINDTEQIIIFISKILESLVSQKIIASFSNVNVTIDPIEPRQIDILFDIVPVFSLRNFSISIGVRAYL